MRFRVELEHLLLPPDHIPGAPLPERVALQIAEYFVEARTRTEVVDQFNAAQAAGYAHLHGYHIRLIEPAMNGAPAP